VVGGPSHASVSVLSTIESLNSSGITYRKIEPPKLAQAFTGALSQPGPHMLNKAMRKAWQKLGTLPAGEHHEFFGVTPFNPSLAEVEAADLRRVASNALASWSSVTLEDLLRSLQECLTTPPPQVGSPVLPAKKVRKRVQKNKAKKDSIHPAPSDPTIGNVRIFLDQARICDL
jgi:hypothetical protein